MSLDTTTRRWIKNAADERAAAAGCRFDERRAARVSEFFGKFLRHSKGEWAGKPFELSEWQFTDVIAPLYGWTLPDERRRFRRAYVEIPKKNGKSTIAAGIGIYHLVADNEPGAHVYSAATDQAQAAIVHGEAVKMIDVSPELTAIAEINRATHLIRIPKTKSLYRALSHEAAGSEGLDASCVIVDELHVWKGRKLWDSLKYAFAARRQGLLFAITTAGDDVLSVCYEQHLYALRVLSGEVPDDRFFAYIRAADPEDDWKDPATWRKANPAIPSTLSEADMASDVAEAENSAIAQQALKRYRLNIWATGGVTWLRPEHWGACRVDADPADLHGKECYAGLDLAKTRDMTALVLVFPGVAGPDTYALLPFFWLPEDVANDADAPAEYRLWAEQKTLETTPGAVTDYAFIKRRFVELAGIFVILAFAFDPWNAEQVSQEITDETGIPRVKFAQTMANFAEATKEFERLVVNGGMMHDGHPILAWHARNCTVKSDPNNNIRPVKPAQGDPRKIDGIVAAIMGLALAQGKQQGAADGPIMQWVEL